MKYAEFKKLPNEISKLQEENKKLNEKLDELNKSFHEVKFAFENPFLFQDGCRLMEPAKCIRETILEWREIEVIGKPTVKESLPSWTTISLSKTYSFNWEYTVRVQGIIGKRTELQLRKCNPV